MPCVFPILLLKVLTLIKQPSPNISSGLSYTVGILVSFLVIFGILVILKSIGFVAGWGYNLQSPMFAILLAYLLFIVGLNLSGVFSIPMLSITEPAIKNNFGSFFTGVLSVLVTTPCTAPFMATAIGFAFTQPPLVTLMIFQVLGLGFAFPYLLLSMLPKLVSFLHKPGDWMEKFKEFLAFPMYASSVWLLWVLIRQTNSNLILTVMTGAIFIVLTIWLCGFIKSFHGTWKNFFIVILIFINFIPIKISYDLINYSYQEQQIAFSESRLTQLLQQQQKVLVVVSADWCITCKINALVLSSSSVQEALNKYNVIYMLADWTKRDEKITQYIKSFDMIGVPLYVLYDGQGEYRILPQPLTQNMILQELESLK